MWLRVTFEPQIDDAGVVCGGVHVVTDVTDLKLGERQLQESIAKQERITQGVISALAQSVEVRDPYTAGHQRRVGELAAAIARELSLGAETISRLEIAGMLHDVGKTVVPAELLAKPGRLSATEFELIKGHAQAAYDILESIEFDFPVADIIVQHHERLDGSGYPSGLSGQQILPEARILAVADVVEAMISHRPYRAALPLDAAVAELEAGAGSRYDAAACTRPSPGSFGRRGSPSPSSRGSRAQIVRAAFLPPQCARLCPRSPCAAAVALRPPPRPRRIHAKPTAMSAPATGPTT